MIRRFFYRLFARLGRGNRSKQARLKRLKRGGYLMKQRRPTTSELLDEFTGFPRRYPNPYYERMDTTTDLESDDFPMTPERRSAIQAWVEKIRAQESGNPVHREN